MCESLQAQECICRLSEVTDWEVGGRTSERDVERIFDTELETGPNKVVAMVQRGTKGVALSCALNRCESYPELPEVDDERCRTCIWGEVHASPYALLQGEFTAEVVDELEVAIARREEEDQKVRAAEAKRLVCPVRLRSGAGRSISSVEGPWGCAHGLTGGMAAGGAGGAGKEG